MNRARPSYGFGKPVFAGLCPQHWVSCRDFWNSDIALKPPQSRESPIRPAPELIVPETAHSVRTLFGPECGCLEARHSCADAILAAESVFCSCLQVN